MIAWYRADDTGRIGATTTIEKYANGMEQFDFPDDFVFDVQSDYRIVGGELVHDPLPEPEPEPGYDELIKAAQDTADEARQIAEQAAAGANPQLSTFAAIALPTMAATMTNEQIISVSTLWPAWSAGGVGYKVGDVVQHGEQVYRCVQAHASQASWAPDAAPSLWDAVTIDPATGYDVWQQPSGAHDAYNVGDRVLYPDADGQVYESVINGNTWSPDAYPAGWKVVDGDAA